MKKWPLITLLMVVIIILGLVSPVSAQDQKSSLRNRIPVLNTISGKAILVPRVAVDKSSVLEPANIIVQVKSGAFFILLQDPVRFDPQAFTEALQIALEVGVKIVDTEPFLWVAVPDNVKRDDVQEALNEIDEELEWSGFRSVGWGNYF